MTETPIGVDVSKDFRDVHRHPDGDGRRFTNNAVGHKALIAWTGNEVSRIVFEPTGPYHGALERGLAKAGLPMVKVNPRQARRFAEATNKLAKTDRLDAALLARMGALHPPISRPNTANSSLPESPLRSPSPPSCESSSSWQTPCSRQGGHGCKKTLDQHGYSSARCGRGQACAMTKVRP
ncbi:IS110 family transposase [Magnetospirillum sulfuroxidans]|uniref:Transposase n=1 Tax=Magnetospirillum sulfuroxidans TaxID=611300 RepID=A0ABS5IBP4_9PROT|nr:transposase [Magnetospirillum sulfuroxidans]MBR9971168.1 transposase [Magnetospirillum sulfuroxidans]